MGHVASSPLSFIFRGYLCWRGHIISLFPKSELEPFFQMYQDLLINHRQQMFHLELEQENRMVVALCDLWRVKAAVLHFGFGV